MSAFWISLPAAWKLQDVQAALNVVVALLSAFSIFVFARVCWQAATAQVAKNRNVPLPALLSVNSVGEVYDIIQLLGFGVFSSLYSRILLQCVVVSLLTAIAFMSGPIARYSTDRGTKISYQSVTGLLANRLNSGISHEQVLWNETQTSLDRAGFPLTELPDFLPDSSIDWQYRSQQWNNSWTMDCNSTDSTQIELYVLNDNCSSLATSIPALVNIFNESSFYAYQSNWEGITNGSTLTKEVLLFDIGWNYDDYDNSTYTYKSVYVTILALHLQNVSTQMDDSSSCNFGKGPVGAAYYTKASCAIRKIHSIANDSTDGAFPDHDSLRFVPMAYTAYFEGRFDREVSAGRPATVIGPSELIRFYQVYQITQATRKMWSVARKLDVEITIVRLSTLFVVVAAIFAVLCTIGVVRFGVFSLRHYNTVGGTPESKLDWMLQSVDAKRSTELLGTANSRHSVASMRSYESGAPNGKRRRSDFESSMYGLHQEPQSVPYHSNWLSRQSSGTPFVYSPLAEFHEHPGSNDTTPLTGYPAQMGSSDASPLTHWSSTTPTFNDYNIRRSSNNYFG